jgi:site-specific recombinase XerD
MYRASGNDLEVVQEQLGHASIKTTTIYAKVTKEDKARAAEALAKAYRSSQQNGASGARQARQAQVGAGIR